MAEDKATLYIKGKQCVKITLNDVRLGDVIGMECVREHIVARLKTVPLTKMGKGVRTRCVVSVLKIIELIHREYPNLEVQNMGAEDIILVWDETRNPNKVWEFLKVVFTTVVCFVGAAFAIMTFNNDSGTTLLFEQMYEMFTGEAYKGFSILELTYSIGLAAGIILFFNHFGKKRLTQDPTPIEVEMRLYENDIETTVIAEEERRGKTLDVD